MIRKIILFAFLIAVAFSGCIEEVPIDITNSQQFLVIDGSISNNNGPHEVKISNSGTFENDNFGFPEPVSGAMVTLFADNGDVVNFTEMEPGAYRIFNYQGVVGATYHIQVQMDEATYSSMPEKLLEPVEALSITYKQDLVEFVNAQNNIVSKYTVTFLSNVALPEDPENVYLKYDVDGVYKFLDIGMFPSFCFIQDFIGANNVSIFGNENSAGSVLHDHEIITLDVNENFYYDYCVLVLQQAITKNAYQYLEKLQQLTDRDGSLFDAPPGLLVGNINNVQDSTETVLGYFRTTAIDSAKIFIERQKLLGANTPLPCPEDVNGDPSSECFCVTKRHRIPEPPYWP